MLLPDAMRDLWTAWSRPLSITTTTDEPPYEIAEVALRALNEAERDMEWRLRRADLHEDARSDLLNDLAAIQAISAMMRAENVGQ
ncbi:MAG: hypothetical protein AB7H90_01050 [Alphaproteobacteria bacterium]